MCSASTWLVQRFTRAQLDEGLSWWDVLGLALLAGIGFTVSLLIGELAFGAGSAQRRRTSRSACCSARCCPHSSPPSCCASATVSTDGLQAEEERDIDADGIPDVYKAGESAS